MATLDAVLATIASRVLTVASPDTPVVSEATHDELREPGRSPRHLEFAVGLPQSAPLAPLGRQRPSSGAPTRHKLVLGTWYQAPTKDRASGYRSAVAHGERIRAVLLAPGTWHGDAQLAWTGTARLPGPPGWVYLDLSFDLTHTDSIS